MSEPRVHWIRRGLRYSPYRTPCHRAASDVVTTGEAAAVTCLRCRQAVARAEGQGLTETDRIPDDYYRLGFTGTFTIRATIEEDPAELEAKLPARVPFGTNSATLALRVDREQDPPRVVLVRLDSVAVVEAFARPAS